MKTTSPGNILPRRSYLGTERGQKIELQIKKDKKYGVVYNKILLFKMQLVRAIIYLWKGKPGQRLQQRGLGREDGKGCGRERRRD